MRKFRFRSIIVFMAALSLVAAACGSDEPTPPADDGGTTAAEGVCADADTAAGDLLAEICTTGTITVATDPAYPPASSFDPVTETYEGFDIDTATEIANRLGVEIAWEEPSFDAITAGGWNGRWDMSVGSMTVTKERAEVLYFTPAYYFTPAAVAVLEDNTEITSPEQLSGKTIGACTACTYDFFLQGTLDIPGYTFDFVIQDATIKTYNTDTDAIQDLVAGRLDAAMSAQSILQGAIDNGSPIKIIGEPLFYEPLSVAFDKSSELDAESLSVAVSTIVEDMHADGTLAEFSMEWYGEDLTVATA